MKLANDKVYLYLLAYYNGKPKPTFVELSKQTNIYRQTVSTHYKELLNSGVVQEEGGQPILKVANPLKIDTKALRELLDKGITDEEELKKIMGKQEEEEIPEGFERGVVYGIKSSGRLLCIESAGSMEEFMCRRDKYIARCSFLDMGSFVILKETKSKRERADCVEQLIWLLRPAWNQRNNNRVD